MRKLLEALYTNCYQDVFRYIYGLCRDTNLAEELAAETFLEVVTCIGTYRKGSDIKTWIIAIARNRWYGYLRKKKNLPVFQEYPFDLISPEPGPEDISMQKEAALRVKQLIAEEPDRTRKIISMRLEGYSFREIGEAVGISENSARVTEFRVRKKIKEALQKEGY